MFAFNFFDFFQIPFSLFTAYQILRSERKDLTYLRSYAILQQTLFAYCKMQLSSICRQLKILTRNELFTNCNQLKSMDCNNAL